MEAVQEKPAVNINPKLIVPFVNSVRSVFSTMVKVGTTVERPHLKTAPEPNYDVSGIIGFSGDVVGSVVVSFQASCAMKLVEAFAGMAMEMGSSDFCDAIRVSSEWRRECRSWPSPDPLAGTPTNPTTTIDASSTSVMLTRAATLTRARTTCDLTSPDSGL